MTLCHFMTIYIVIKQLLVVPIFGIYYEVEIRGGSCGGKPFSIKLVHYCHGLINEVESDLIIVNIS